MSRRHRHLSFSHSPSPPILDFLLPAGIFVALVCELDCCNGWPLDFSYLFPDENWFSTIFEMNLYKLLDLNFILYHPNSCSFSEDLQLDSLWS